MGTSRTTNGKKYPLWVIRYWEELIPIHTVHEKWINAEESLQKRNETYQSVSSSLPNPAAIPALIQRVYNALSCVPWTGNIQGLSTSTPTHYLADYATMEWMCDEHIIQMLDLLQQDVIQEGFSESIEIESVWFLPMLRKGYQDQDEYMTHTSYWWLRRQGQAFGTGDCE